MKIVFVVAVFPPEPEPTAVMAEELVRAWAGSGHHLTVICPFPNRPAGKIYAGYRRLLWHRTVAGSVEVLRVPTWLVGSKRRSFDRILENCTFALSAFIAILCQRRVDILIAEGWPLFAQLACVTGGRLRGTPVVNYIKDLYPEAAEAAGILRSNGPLSRLLRAVDTAVCRAAVRSIAISDGMKSRIVNTRRVPPDQVTVIPDWLNLDQIKPDPESNWRLEVGLNPDEFVCMFAGNLGMASGVSILADVAHILRDEPGLRLVCVGEGVAREQLAAAVAQNHLDNLTLLPLQPRHKVASMQSSADLMLLTCAPNVGDSSVPSKLITYLAVGKPVVCAVPPASDIGRLVSDNNLGRVVLPGDPAALAEAIREVRALPADERATMSHRARSVAEQRHSLRAALAKFDSILSDSSRSTAPAGRPLRH